MTLGSAFAAVSLALWCLAPSTTESAAANGDTRTLHFYHTHTGETIDATFRVDGHYDPTVLRQLNHFLRDWRNNDEHEMDPRLFDAVWEAYRTAGATDRIQIYSAYRSPETNAMLRRRSRAVAEHSQHMLGKAMDTTMPGFPMQRIREAGMKLQHGGVGWYPSANFVHLDVGGVRSWPRMSYEQLASLFPDGKTVHIAADGRTLPGYDQARTEIAERGGTEVPPAQESSGFFAWLFGGGSGGGATAREDEEDRRAPVAVASAAPPAAQQQAAEPSQEPQAAPALAYASAAPTEAPALDARPQIEGQQGSAQVASFDTANPDRSAPPPSEPMSSSSMSSSSMSSSSMSSSSMSSSSMSSLPMPLPPRRPADLDLASADVDIPLPPARPDALDHLPTATIRFSDAQANPTRLASRSDSIGGLITATASGVPMIRRSSLPAIITHDADGHDAFPGQALAFASSESIPDLRPVPLPVARPSNLAKPMALRSARRRVIIPVKPTPDEDLAQSDVEPTGLAGPQVKGLRRAAKQMAEKASL